MDVSHIHMVLSKFCTSHVSIPIKVNEFEEMYDNVVCDKNTPNVFDTLDDILQECKAHRNKVGHAGHVGHVKRKEVVAQPSSSQHVHAEPKQRIQQEPTKSIYIDEFFYTLSCIKDPLLTLKGFDSFHKSALTKAKHELMAFVDNTQVKVLDMAKYKYTKKGLRDMINKCFTPTTDEVFDWSLVKPLLVVSVRYLQMGIIFHVNGEIKEQFPLPASMTTTNETKPQITIDYVNGKFII
jgi:hypothetical protein